MDQENLLQNPGLGEDFGPYRNDETLQTAAGWAPWWLPAAPASRRGRTASRSLTPTSWIT